MAQPLTVVQYSLANYLTKGWRIRGETQGRGYQNTNPASADPANYGGWWVPWPNPWLAAGVLFLWIDFNPPVNGRYSFDPWVRFTHVEYTFLEAELAALTGQAVVVGQDIGFRFTSFLSLLTKNGLGGPRPYLELVADATTVRFVPTNGFNFWTLPPGGHPNIQDAYFFVPLGASKSVTVRMGATDIAPSCNISWSLDTLEIAVFPPPGGGGGPGGGGIVPGVEPPPVFEPVPAACSVLDILVRAQEEVGWPFGSLSAAADTLARYAKQLLSRCLASWHGNEVEAPSPLEIDLTQNPVGGGFGVNFGFNFGGGPVNPGGVLLEHPLPDLEAIWYVEARRVTTGQWESVHIVAPDDRMAGLVPRAMLADQKLVFVEYQAEWNGVFDFVRIRGAARHPTPNDWQTSLAPNVHIGPLFCRACELYMARHLALEWREMAQAQALGRELRSVTTSLLNQSRSQGWAETLRGGRR